jgi:hypothetical protein
MEIYPCYSRLKVLVIIYGHSFFEEFTAYGEFGRIFQAKTKNLYTRHADISSLYVGG